MNYEGKLFQNYEPIPIDALKNQADSLLNMVIEEQRPLLVSTNNGEEVLLFPQNLVDPLCDNDYCLILH